MRHMTVGQVVDYCIIYNERANPSKKPAKRKATQADINALWG